MTARLLKCEDLEGEQVFSKLRKFEAESKFYLIEMVPADKFPVVLGRKLRQLRRTAGKSCFAAKVLDGWYAD